MNNLVAYSADTLPAEAHQRLQVWAVAARDAMASNTQRAYATDSRAFAAWCAGHGIATLPASPDAVAAYLRAESDSGKAVATVRRRAATISRMHKAAELTNPCASELVRLALKGIARSRGTDQKQAAGLTERDTLTIRARLGEGIKDARNLALVLAGRDLLARASELVGLTVADVTKADDGALVRMRRAKTSTDSHAYYLGTEAAQAVAVWLDRAGITEGPIFQSLTKAGRTTGRALTTRDVRRILKAVAIAARLEHGASISGHSLRVGMAQDLVAADLDVASVMQAGGWATPRMVARYSEKLTARRGAVARYYGNRQ